MGAGKNKARRKKKRISKHVLAARERQRRGRFEEAGGGEGAGAGSRGAAAAPSTAPSTAAAAEAPKGGGGRGGGKSGGRDRRERDPAEAAAYLSSWRHRDASGGAWKFNKNLQSWLIRHMYEAEKVPKAAFADLAEYLSGSRGATRTRVREDAARRALRYRRWEKSDAAGGGEGKGEGTERSSGGNEEGNDFERWSALDDHDKRKEYKRARKILDVLTEGKVDES